MGLHFTITHCLNAIFCKNITQNLRNVAKLFDDKMIVDLNINLTYSKIQSDFPQYYGYGEPAFFYHSKSDALEIGYDYPQGLIKNRILYDQSNITLDESDFNFEMNFDYKEINSTKLYPYDIEIAINSDFEALFYLGGETDIEDYQIDFEYLISRYVVKGMGVFSRYSNYWSDVVTTAPRKTYMQKVGNEFSERISSFSLPTLYDRHLYIIIQRTFIWQFYKESLSLTHVAPEKTMLNTFHRWLTFGNSFSKNLKLYVLMPKNVRFIFETYGYDGLLINDALHNGKVRMDLLHRSYCDTIEYLICSHFVLGKKFDEIYEKIKIGHKILRLLAILGYKLKPSKE